MLTEDDDAPLLTADDVIKFEASQCVHRLLSRFVDLVKSLVCDFQELVPEPRQMELFLSYLTDLLWASQIAAKLEISREFIHIWVDTSANIVKISEQSCPIDELNGIKVKALEVTTKVLEAIAYGTVVLPPLERLQMVMTWLPYIRMMKPLTDSFSSDEDNNLLVKFDCELWQSLESSLVLVVSGETGCGKTTQLPQFILEEEISSLRGGNCCIICTQPRRISAISVAARVSSERGEKLGETVGYQIRLESKRSDETRLLFCTTGVFLRQLVL
ncbi:BTB/POZ domain-containing protein At3g05675-like [Primulina huaijiensis]|uniref:BTB/POZ domain-containing protein At3g05675-like n=1 Tax=Primulina huaijiensis TaxID=1492673 RepID=UPI003CC741A2